MLKRFSKVNRILLLLSLIVGVALFAAPSSYADDIDDAITFGEYMYNTDERDSMKAAAAAEYTTTDIYNFLYSAMRYSTNALSSSYALPRIERYMWLLSNNINGPGTSVASVTLRDMIQELLEGNSDWTLAMGPLQYLASQFNTIYDGTTYVAFKDIMAILATRSMSSDDSLTNIATTNSGIINTITSSNSILQTISNGDTFTWTNYSPSGFAYYGTSNTGIDGTYSTTSKNGNPLYIKLNIGGSANAGFYRMTLPVSAYPRSYDRDNVKIYQVIDNEILLTDIWGFIQNSNLYFSSLPETTENLTIIIELSCNNSYWTSSTSTPVFQVTGNQYLKSWQLREVMSVFHIEEMLDQVMDEVASDQMAAARSESQEVIDDTLDGFTGDGSAAIKKSQTSSMKGLSSDLQSGLDGGGSVGDATQVFSSGSDLWQWFSTQNQNDINQLYVPGNRSNLRKSASPQGEGWEIIDAITPNEQEYRDHLVGGDR